MKIQIGTGIKVTGLLPNEKVSYKGILQSGEVFVIIEPAGNYSNSRVYFQVPGKRRKEIKVISVVRYRDGGTTDISTERGDFHFPSPFSSKPFPRASFSEPGNNIKEMEQ